MVGWEGAALVLPLRAIVAESEVPVVMVKIEADETEPGVKPAFRRTQTICPDPARLEGDNVVVDA